MNNERIEGAAKHLLQVVEEETGLKFEKVAMHWLENKSLQMHEGALPEGLEWRELYTSMETNSRTMVADTVNTSFYVRVPWEGKEEQ